MYRFPIFNLQMMQYLFCMASQVYITNLKAVLLCFERISDLRVNMEKCKVFGLNLAEGELFIYTTILGG